MTGVGNLKEGEPEEVEGSFFCPCCGRTLGPEEKSFYPAHLGENTYYCCDCVASEDAPPWITPSGS